MDHLLLLFTIFTLFQCKPETIVNAFLPSKQACKNRRYLIISTVFRFDQNLISTQRSLGRVGFGEEMSCFIPILKWILCMEEDEDRYMRYQRQRQGNYVLNRDLNNDSISKTSAPFTSQTNSRQTTSCGIHNERYPSQLKSTFNLNREAIDNNSVTIKLSGKEVKSSTVSAVSGVNHRNVGVTSLFASPSLVHSRQSPSVTTKPNVSSISEKPKGLQPSYFSDYGPRVGDSHKGTNTLKSTSNKETFDSNFVSIKLSGNDTFKSTMSSTVSGISSKNTSVTSQFALPPVHSQKPTTITAKPSLSSISDNPSEIPEKLNSVASSSSTGDVHQSQDANNGTNKLNDHRQSYDFSSAASKPLQSSPKLPLFSHSFKLSPPASESAKPHSSPKTHESSPSLFEKCHSPEPPPLSTKPKMYPAPSSSFSPEKKAKYVWVEKGAPSTYVFPNESSPSLFEKSHSPNPPPLSTKPKMYPAPSSSFSPEEKAKYVWVEKGAPSTDVFPNELSPSLFEKSHSPKPPPLSTIPKMYPAPSSSFSPEKKAKYVWVEKGAPSTYVFPNEIKSLIEKDIVPGVLKMPLSMSSYKDYFHALLYAEDCHLEKWDGFEMENLTLDLHEAAIYTRRGKQKNLNVDDEKDEKTFVAFEIDKIPERRPFLLSRDFVSLKPSSRKDKTFQGVIYRVVKSNLVLAEFGEKFYAQHHPDCKYDVKFSFNRVCLKRAHQAIAAASDPLFRNFLFPNVAPKHELPSTELFLLYKYRIDALAVRQILRLQGAPPYLVEGPISVIERKHLSRTGVVIVEAILRIFRAEPSKRILLCAPVNRTCDLLMRGLKKEMAESDMFRANAAFRELDGVPIDILPSCLYVKDMDCFSCPSLEELKKYKVILSTFMSSYRLYGEGITAGYFSHIFLVDASSATEPETIIPLANFANETTTVVVTGAPRNHSGWVRSEIARENGLMTSYFERLHESGLYKKLDLKVITQLEDIKQGTNDICSSLPNFLDLISLYDTVTN